MVLNGLVPDALLDEITDPSDWSNSRFPQLGELDSYLRCQICKEFFKAPVVTTCGHVFCSVCIRRSLSKSNICPVCLEETYESGLRKVLLLDNICKWFGNNRSEIMKNLELDHVNDSQSEENSVIHPDDYDTSKDIANIANISDKFPSTDPPLSLEDSNANTANYNNNSGQNEDDILAECPICGVFLPLSEIQGSHIDTCLKTDPKDRKLNDKQIQNDKGKTIHSFFKNDITKSPVQNKNKTKSPDHSQLQPKSVKKKQRLPNLDTSISTSKLRDKLNSLHLPSHGSRTQMEQRMKEFITLYNANLDSIAPVNDRILVDRLQKWERLITSKRKLNGIDPDPNGTAPINYDEQTIKRQKMESSEWNSKNKNEFADLIKKAKANMQKQKNKAKLNQEQNDEDEFSDNDIEVLL